MSIDYKEFCYPKPSFKENRRVTVSKETYEKVFKACKGRCVLCGSSNNLELHHINGRGKYLTDEPLNCVMLCRNCHHNVVHANQKKYRPILNDIRKNLK